MIKIASSDEGYSTISVPPSVKRTLQSQRRERMGGVMDLFAENIRLKQERAHSRLMDLLTEEDLKEIGESSREFRRSFRIGEGRALDRSDSRENFSSQGDRSHG